MGVKQVKAVINGVTTVLTLNSSTGKYEATITAPAKSDRTLLSGVCNRGGLGWKYNHGE